MIVETWSRSVKVQVVVNQGLAATRSPSLSLYMSLIATAKLAQADPFDYLTELQRHAAESAASPSDWLPWNYRATLNARAPPA